MEIQIASRDSVAVVPTMALRADSDIPTAAIMLGLEEAQLRAALGRTDEEPRMQAQRLDARTGATATGGTGADRGPGIRSAGSVTDYQFGGDYWVVALRDGEPVPVPVRTGLTDLEFSEIVAGLEPDDEVLLLPSTSLFEQQEMLQQFISNRFSSTPFQQQGGGGGGRFR